MIFYRRFFVFYNLYSTFLIQLFFKLESLNYLWSVLLCMDSEDANERGQVVVVQYLKISNPFFGGESGLFVLALVTTVTMNLD